MKCPFCAEEIKDAARLCRFCGAEKQADGKWVSTGKTRPLASRHKGRFTITSAGGFLLLSGVLSFVWMTSEVPLLGAMRGGATALCYNLFFAVLFLGMGLGLIIGRAWGYRLLLAGTGVYSLDRLLFLWDKDARDAYLSASGLPRQIETLAYLNMIERGIILTIFVSLVCWWGFAIYIYLRRDYFR